MKDVQWAREKRDHKDDVFWLFSFAYSSTCYLFYGMKAENGREAGKQKSDHKDDDSSLLLLSLRSTCYLFNGMEAEEGREASKREKRS